MFGFVKKVFATVLLFWNKTVFSYNDYGIFAMTTKNKLNMYEYTHLCEIIWVYSIHVLVKLAL